MQTRNQNHARRVFGTRYNNQISFVSNFSEWVNDEKNSLIDYGVVNLAGAPIADARWSKRRKVVLESSRIGVTQNLIQQVSKSRRRPKVWVNASAIGFYGSGEAPVDETAPAGNGYASELCQKWEGALVSMPEDIPKAILRFGVVLGNGGALKKLLPMYKLGLGGPIGDGRQGFSWVHINDVVNAILWVATSALSDGIYSKTHSQAFNLSSPNPVSQKEFAQTLGKCLNRPSFIPTPTWLLRMMFGNMAQELLIEGQFVQPAKLLNAGFTFEHPELAPALNSVLSTPE